jgi:hypothetical protein
MDASGMIDILWHPAIHYPILWVWFLYSIVIWVGVTICVGAVLALPWCFTCPFVLIMSIPFCIFWCCFVIFAYFTWWCVFPWLIYTAFWSFWIGWVWVLSIGTAWVIGTLLCYWMFWVAIYGTIQFIFMMDYVALWSKAAAAIKPAAGDDA